MGGNEQRPASGNEDKNEPVIIRKRRWWRQFQHREVLFLIDLAILAAAFLAACLLRFDFRIPPDTLTQLPLVMLIQLVCLVLCGVHEFEWRFIGMDALDSFGKAAIYSLGASSLLVLILRLWLPITLQNWRVPISVNIITTVFAFGGLLAVRVLRRRLYEWERPQVVKNEARFEIVYPTRVKVKRGKRTAYLRVAEIDLIEADEGYARLFLQNGDSYLLDKRLNQLQAQLDPREFMRVYRSAIVRISRVSDLENPEPGRYFATLEGFLRKKKKVPVSRRSYQGLVRSLLFAT